MPSERFSRLDILQKSFQDKLHLWKTREKSECRSKANPEHISVAKTTSRDDSSNGEDSKVLTDDSATCLAASSCHIPAEASKDSKQPIPLSTSSRNTVMEKQSEVICDNRIEGQLMRSNQNAGRTVDLSNSRECQLSSIAHSAATEPDDVFFDIPVERRNISVAQTGTC